VLPDPVRALLELALVATALAAAMVIVHRVTCDQQITGDAKLLAGALLTACWLVESVRVPVGLDRVGRVRSMSGVNALLLPASILLPPALFLLVGIGSAIPIVRALGVLGSLTEASIRVAQMSAAALAFYVVNPWGAEVAEVGAWTSPLAVLGLVLAGAAMLLVESACTARSLRVGEGLLPEDIPWASGRDLVADTPEVAIGALACVLMAAPAALVLLVPLFLLENQMLRAHAAQLCGYKDAKTGLLTLTAFHDLAAGEMARAARTDQPVAALMMDLDGLKEVNRTQGHLAGDRGIAAVGQLLQGACRREDLVCRFGGDEFCLLLPGVSLEQAALVGERIRFTAKETVVPGFVVGRGLSLSVGVAVAEPGEDVTALLNRADEGLLEAKHRGGNRVRVVTPTPA
jgi:diguanylate cyclase (GGDEF)-like protein